MIIIQTPEVMLGRTAISISPTTPLVGLFSGIVMSTLKIFLASEGWVLAYNDALPMNASILSAKQNSAQKLGAQSA